MISSRSAPPGEPHMRASSGSANPNANAPTSDTERSSSQGPGRPHVKNSLSMQTVDSGDEETEELPPASEANSYEDSEEEEVDEDESEDDQRPLFEYVLIVRHGDPDPTKDGTDRAILCRQIPAPSSVESAGRVDLPDETADFCIPTGHDVTVPEGEFYFTVMTGQDASKLYVGFIYLEDYASQGQDTNNSSEAGSFGEGGNIAIPHTQSTSELPQGVDRPSTTNIRHTASIGSSHHTRQSSGNSAPKIPSRTNTTIAQSRRMSEVLRAPEGFVIQKHGIVIALISRHFLPDTMRSILKDLYEQYAEPPSCFGVPAFDSIRTRTAYGKAPFEEVAMKICKNLKWGHPGKEPQVNLTQICRREVALIPKQYSENQQFNLSFATLFSCISYETYFVILYCLLRECSLLVRSYSLWRLGGCCEGLRLSLDPLQWVNVYIPVLPTDRIEIIGSPVPAILGMLTNLSQLANFEEGFDNFLVVDLDRDIIEARPQIPGLDEFRDIIERHRLQEKLLHGARKNYHTYFSRTLVEVKRNAPPPSRLLLMSLSSMQDVCDTRVEESTEFPIGQAYSKAKKLMDESAVDPFYCFNVIFSQSNMKAMTSMQRRAFNTIPCLLQDGFVKVDNGNVSQFDIDFYWGLQCEMQNRTASENKQLPPWIASQRWEWVANIHNSMKAWIETALQPLKSSKGVSDGRASSLVRQGIEGTMLVYGYLEPQRKLADVHLSSANISEVNHRVLLHPRNRYMVSSAVTVKNRFPLNGRNIPLSMPLPSREQPIRTRSQSDTRLYVKAPSDEVEGYKKQCKDMAKLVKRLMYEESNIMNALKQVADERTMYRKQSKQLEKRTEDNEARRRKLSERIELLESKLSGANSTINNLEETAQEQEYYIDSLHELLATIPASELTNPKSHAPAEQMHAALQNSEKFLTELESIEPPNTVSSIEKTLNDTLSSIKKGIKQAQDAMHASNSKRASGYSQIIGREDSSSIKEVIYRSIDAIQNLHRVLSSWLKQLQNQTKKGTENTTPSTVSSTQQDSEDPQLSNTEKLATLRGKLKALDNSRF